MAEHQTSEAIWSDRPTILWHSNYIQAIRHGSVSPDNFHQSYYGRGGESTHVH